MNRNDFQNLAQIRIDEAEALIAADLYSGAFYLAGYAVEFGLKACISKQTRQYDFPDKSRANESYSHSLKQLSKVAELNQQQIDAEEKTNPGFAANWGHTAGRWSERLSEAVIQGSLLRSPDEPPVVSQRSHRCPVDIY